MAENKYATVDNTSNKTASWMEFSQKHNTMRPKKKRKRHMHFMLSYEKIRTVTSVHTRWDRVLLKYSPESRIYFPHLISTCKTRECRLCGLDSNKLFQNYDLRVFGKKILFGVWKWVVLYNKISPLCLIP